MKKSWLTVLLLLLFGAGLWYASTQQFFQTGTSEPQQKLLQLDAEQVQSIVVQGADAATKTESIKLERQNKDWVMIQPATYPINVYPVQDWLSSLAAVEIAAMVEEQAMDLGKYGLEQPTAQYRITLKDGTSQTIKEGNPSPLADYVYVAINEETTVYQVAASQLVSLNRSAVDFAIKEPIQLNTDQVQAVTLTSAGTTYKLKRERASSTDKPTNNAAEPNHEQGASAMESEPKWTLNGKPLQEEQIITLLNHISSWSTSEAPKPAKQWTKPTSTLAEPLLTLQVTSAKEDGVHKTVHQPVQKPSEQTTLYHGYVDAEKDTVWLVSSQSEWAYGIERHKIDQSLQMWEEQHRTAAVK
ncbi:DUF4340 domain-containing protein [Paenibacillus sp. 481]|uniref:DUF4340 domain-containing protein n=1 Tax=Paenibacillus sp. 481 TaxID=2835869 RepID=UPI001E5E87BF|nr:DUF4340 domain-containing protein [Paenibacillus sp. 481]UHA74478.1 DUF4340 domain-containing protein [Paenibacillus sp. 481]